MTESSEEFLSKHDNPNLEIGTGLATCASCCPAGQEPTYLEGTCGRCLFAEQPAKCDCPNLFLDNHQEGCPYYRQLGQSPNVWGIPRKECDGGGDETNTKSKGQRRSY